MKFVALNCLSCGANIDLNSDKQLAFCPYCGAKMLIDDEVQKIELSGKVEVSGIPTLDRLCTNAETFIGIGDYKNADRTIREIYKNYPNDYRGYFLALLSRIRSKPHLDYPVSNTPPYNVSGFYRSIPLMTDICTLANQALHFAPKEKHQEIKDLASNWLKPLKGISEDATGKLQEFYRLEDVCTRQKDEIRQKISGMNSDISIMETKQKRQVLISGLSLVAFFIGAFLFARNIAFAPLVLAALISAVVFLILHLITKSKVVISKRKVEKTYLVLDGVNSKNGHSGWPDDQGTPENTSNALDTFFSSLNRFSEL